MVNIKERLKKKSFLITAMLLVFGIIITLMKLIPNDYWWHVKAGEYIVKNKSIPFTDVFSWYGIENNLYWHSHEWLSEVFIYIADLAGGFVGVVIFITICVSSLFIFLYLANKEKYEKHFTFTFFWIIFGAVLFGRVISPRPHMISFLLFAFTLSVLFKYREDEDSKIIWFLPLISIAWVNFHGGSSNLPYVLAIIFVITGLFDFNIGRLKFDKISKKQIKNYLLASLIAFLCLIINPHGIDMITYPYANMSDTIMLNLILEWRSPDLKKITDLVYILPIIVSVLAFIKTKKEILFVDLTMIGAFSYLTLKSVRFSMLLYITVTFVIYRYLEDIKIENMKINIVNEMIELFPKAIEKISIIFVGSGIVFLSLMIFTNSNKDLFKSDIISDEIITYIKEVNPDRLYNDYNYGGYLIYNDIKPMIDGRADMYSATLLKDYVKFSSRLDTTLTERYDFDYFLVDKDLVLDNSFSLQEDKYEKIAEDKRCVLYKNLEYKKSES